MTAFLRFRTASPDETRAFGRALGAALSRGGFVGFEGQLGSGKTVAIQGAAEGLGYEGYVTSPTFIIVNEYEGRVPILHVDLYRIEDARELEALGYREIFFVDGVALVEWADRAPELLPPDRLRVVIDIEGPDDRAFTVSAFGNGGAKLLARLRESWPA
ncbi:MAG: tRNA (adenosine(37)-N6)-threonylcarbamoyltransferase complex ATPase subunit type 1 TsaE, partial [Candidatus Eisenbacteria sp.]|nr:tRNA (adenosine(37)-N6)-threonylcarbamoyltransferase complex ATPase subunit type 1 TsaE [Candidatus Eisenbacteria bacterium]